MDDDSAQFIYQVSSEEEQFFEESQYYHYLNGEFLDAISEWFD